MKAIVVGAGPVGSYAAALLAKKYDVQLFEEHDKIGLPLQCTGIVTPEIFDFIQKKNRFIINRIRDVSIFAPNGRFLSLSFKNPDIVLDRAGFDRHFFERAKDAGASCSLGTRFLSAKGKTCHLQNVKSKKRIMQDYDVIVGADGPNSAVAKKAGLFMKRKFFIGAQAVIRCSNDNSVHFYPGTSGFGWAVPEDEATLRVGFASMANPRPGLDFLLKKYGKHIISVQGGIIPVYDPMQRLSFESTYLVGDAAQLVKATTGGGIVPGLLSSRLLAQALIEKKDYEALVAKQIRPSLRTHLKLRKIMDCFTEKEWNGLVSDFSKPPMVNLLQDINRDKPMKLLVSAIMRNPFLIRYGIRHLGALMGR